ncbi:Bug family tripartite tricarboxylate transporter substrate binding protein [Alicycliphilus denitrificans]|uniref:Bug family tripartite tricarboxylate transporter substrate binding protein n=1 Tax=Alicycliphilus denitrificans TaxID=179636 RepID=UPI003A8123DB
MFLSKRAFFVSCLGLVALGASTDSALAQVNWPQRPIKFVVPYAPGGALDTLARSIGPVLSEKLGQPVVIENRPGAGTALAASALAKAAPDGYSIMLGGSATLTFNPALKNDLQYDSLKSFTHLALVADVPLVIVANNESGIQAVADLVRLAKATPDRISYGSFGMGSSAHFGGEMLKHALGINMTHVPYNGSSQSMTGLMGGQIQVAVDTASASSALIQSGKVKGIATLSAKRLASMPSLPTVAESGAAGFELNTWAAIFAPAGLPEDVRQKLEGALASALQSPEIVSKITSMGLVPSYGNGSALRERTEKEMLLIKSVAVRSKIQAD